MTKFREKLIDFKKRLSDRRMYSIVIVVLAVLIGFNIYQYKKMSEYRQQLDNLYNRAFFDMTSYVNNVETLLIKSLLSSTPNMTASTLQEAWRQANLAQTNLGQLPVSQGALANTSKFLIQVGDLAYTLNTQNMSGNNLTDEQYTTIEKLHGFSVTLRDSLAQLENELTSGRVKWGELAKEGEGTFQKASTEMPTQQIANIDKNFQEMPTLIYDGPFSDHMLTANPKFLTGKTITKEQAKEKITALFGSENIAEITESSDNESDRVKTYGFTIKYTGRPAEESTVVNITKEDGYVYWMLNSRNVAEEKITIEQAKDIAVKFLEKAGFKDMKATYHMKQENNAVINYAYSKDNVTYYSDLIKVKVALDNGEITGFESKGYVFSHSDREIPKDIISLEDAKSKIHKKVEILSNSMAMIPTEYNTEVYVYEFKGKLNNISFVEYIGAVSGKEEKIFIIIDGPEGTLTF